MRILVWFFIGIIVTPLLVYFFGFAYLFCPSIFASFILACIMLPFMKGEPRIRRRKG